MSKVEEIAMEHCCAKCVHNKFGCGIKLSTHGRDCIECGNYIKGYEQAEKDLELTWEDIESICSIQYIVLNEYNDYDEPSSNILYQEVLKRFKDLKHVK